MKLHGNAKGFTLIEVLVAIGLFSLVSMAIYIVFSSTQNAYSYNVKTVDLRQNLRATLDFMAGEIMGKAGNPGYDKTQNEEGFAVTGFVKATRDSVSFTSDLDLDNTVQAITFKLSAGIDSDANGVVDSSVGTGALVRVIDAGSEEVVMDDVQAVQFAYAFDDDNDGELDFTDTNGNGQMDSDEIIWAYDRSNAGNLNMNINGTALAETVSFRRIRLVRIWLLGRTAGKLKIPEDSRNYEMGGITVSGNNDTYKRFLLSTTVKCRNMGLR